MTNVPAFTEAEQNTAANLNDGEYHGSLMV